MTSKAPEPNSSAKARPSEADHDRNTPGKGKGLAESSVNEPHIEPTDASSDASKDKSA
jgi:hypothetical protein